VLSSSARGDPSARVPGQEVSCAVFHRPLAGPLGGGDVVVTGESLHPPGHTARAGRARRTADAQHADPVAVAGVGLDPPPGHSTRCRPRWGRRRHSWAKPLSAGTQRVDRRCWSQTPAARQGAAAGLPRPPSGWELYQTLAPLLADHQIKALIDHMGPRKGPSRVTGQLSETATGSATPLAPRGRRPSTRLQPVSAISVAQPALSQGSATVSAWVTCSATPGSPPPTSSRTCRSTRSSVLAATGCSPRSRAGGRFQIPAGNAGPGVPIVRHALPSEAPPAHPTDRSTRPAASLDPERPASARAARPPVRQ
jgi:hypothetical protein